MSDIDFEEQLALEQKEKEEEEKRAANTRTDPDGTQYEWDEEKKAWFPKIDQNFIAQYQMNYGRGDNSNSKAPANPSSTSDPNQTSEGQSQGEGQSYADYYNYYSYYQDYYNAAAQQETILGRKKKPKVAEDTHEEAIEKLEQLENAMDQVKEGEGDLSGSLEGEDMSNYTEEQIKQYNEYWSYYYGTDYHDYYADCMKQQKEGQGESNKGEGQVEKGQGTGQQSDDQKKGKKRKVNPQPPRPEGWFSMDESNNTNVYVSGLPFDITDDDFKELMSKYGLIMFDPHTKKPKLKLYRDENGDPKGDGRCCYIKIESVDLALKLLDGYDFRGHKIHVEKASFQMKGDFDPSKKRKKLTNKEKKKMKERQAKLFDWRPERPQGGRSKHERVVILKNMFDPASFEENPVLINTLRNDVRNECTKYGEVKKVTVYDRNPDGVVSVSYKEPEEADNCVEYMNHRYFAQRRVMAATWDGQTKYEVIETEEEKEKRLKKWNQFLDSDDIAKLDDTAKTTQQTKDSNVVQPSEKEAKNSDSTVAPPSDQNNDIEIKSVKETHSKSEDSANRS